jgi:hypothetical protein
MARLQWCRKHIDDVAEACDLSRQSVGEVKAAAEFCDTHDDFSSLPTRPILALIRVKDDNVRDKAISLVENVLKSKTPTGGKRVKSLTEREIKKIIGIAEGEIRAELGQQYKETELNRKTQLDKIEETAPTEIAFSSEPTAPAVIKDTRPRNEQLIERFMTSFPQRFPTKESVISEALDSLAKEVFK